ANGRLRGFDEFQRVLGSELAGVVLTAHPTFSLSSAANGIALELMRDGIAGGRGAAGGGPAGGVGAGGALRGGAAAVTVHRDAPPTLNAELELSIAAIHSLRKAMRRLLRSAVDVAARLYPTEFQRSSPRLPTV